MPPRNGNQVYGPRAQAWEGATCLLDRGTIGGIASASLGHRLHVCPNALVGLSQRSPRDGKAVAGFGLP